MKVLIVDDQKEVAEILALTLQSHQHQIVAIAHSGLAAIRAYSRETPDVVLMDYQMPRLNGATACRHILSCDPAAKVIFLSGQLGTDDPIFTSSGAVGALQKPFLSRELDALLAKIAVSLN